MNGSEKRCTEILIWSDVDVMFANGSLLETATYNGSPSERKCRTTDYSRKVTGICRDVPRTDPPRALVASKIGFNESADMICDHDRRSEPISAIAVWLR